MSRRKYKINKKPKEKQQSNYKPRKYKKSQKSQMNEGGFYEGMPGAVIDKNGNRSMIHFIVTPEGRSTCYIHAHPKLCKTAIQQAMSNPMTKGIVFGAVIDKTFSSKNPLNWPIRFRFFLYRYFSYLKAKRQANKNAKAEKLQKAGRPMESV